MTLKSVIDKARAYVAEGGSPNAVLATNTKTSWSIFDNVPQLTCYGGCPVRRSCYDVKLLKLRPNVLEGRAKRHFYLDNCHPAYVDQAIREIRKVRATKVRIYGGGDYSAAQLPAIESVLSRLPNVTFYMISKTIRAFPQHAIRLLAHRNFFLNMSEMALYQFGPSWDYIRAHPRVNTVYTLMPDETDFRLAGSADIVFNVSKSRKNIARYKLAKLPLCPCDAKDIPSKGACGACNLCSTKGGVKWNPTK